MSNRRVIIALKGLGALANHGVYDFERANPQHFSADVIMWVDTPAAADDIASTVSYADIADETMAILTGRAVDLIETLAETIASRVMTHEGVVGVEVSVHKPNAPISHPFEDVSVTVRQGQTGDLPLSLSMRGLYEAEDGSVLTGEVEALTSAARAPIPAAQMPRRSTAPRHSVPAPQRGKERRVVLALGGNLGDVPVTLHDAIEALSYMDGFDIDDVSPIMRTTPVLAPGQAPQPDYWNAVVLGHATCTPMELLEQTSRIERELGRERHERWGARTIDIDIIQVEGVVSADPTLALPHPRARSRAFVLAPWLLCDPEARLEGVGSVSDLLARTPDREGIIDAVDDWLEDPAAVIEDSDLLLAQRAEQAAADMREIIGTLTGEISQVTNLTARPSDAQADSSREDAPTPTLARAPAGADPATWNRLWARWASTEVGEDISRSMGIARPEATREASQSTDNASGGPAPTAPEPFATPVEEPPAAPTPEGTYREEPREEAPRDTARAAKSARPAWHPVSSVPADSPSGRMTRRVGSGAAFTPRGEKPRWQPVYGQQDESHSISLPDWNFSVGEAEQVRVVDDRTGMAENATTPANNVTVHADGRSTILEPGLPEDTPVGPIPEDEATQTGILRRVVVRPTMTGAIPIVKRRS